MAAGALQTQFRETAMSLMVVTMVKNAGYPTLVPSHGDGKVSIRKLLNADDEKHARTIIDNDIATVSIRNEEIVTITRLPHSGSGIAPFVVFTNAAKHTSYFKKTDNLVMLVESSQSHWPAISQLDPMEILNPDMLK